MSNPRVVAGCGLGVIAAFVAGIVVAPSATPSSPVPVPTVTVTETATKTVVEKEPAKLPQSCLQAVAKIAEFETNVGAMSKAAGEIKSQTSELQTLAAFPDAVAMTPLIVAQNDSVYSLNNAAVDSTAQYSEIQTTVEACVRDTAP